VFTVVIDPLDDRVMLKEPAPKLPSRLPLHVPKSAESTAPRGEGSAGTGVIEIDAGVGAVGVELVPFPPQDVRLSISSAKDVNRLADFIGHPVCPLVDSQATDEIRVRLSPLERQRSFTISMKRPRVSYIAACQVVRRDRWMPSCPSHLKLPAKKAKLRC